jgi:LPS sulfotransferase NodH
VTTSPSYLVCATQRTGTTLLCRALSDTGVCGRPDEYFLAVDETEQPGWPSWEKGPFGVAHGAKDRAHYLEIVRQLGSTPNGVFGAKLMWNNVEWALRKFQEMPQFVGLDRAAIFHAAFPDLHVVNVTRRDHLRQAVSWARMAQDGVWVVSDSEPASPARVAGYDADLIAGLERLIVEGEAGWRALCCELGVVPYEVVYEDLVAPGGLAAAVSGVLEHLGIDGTTVATPIARTHRQADDVNEDWVTRYRALPSPNTC